MKVLVACEESGRVRDAFIRHGHDAMSCDLLPTARPGPHYQGDARDVLGDGWDMMIGHPECTYLCRAGQRWLNAPDDDRPGRLKGEPRWAATLEAVDWFVELMTAPIPLIALENPRPGSHVAPVIGKPDQVVQPWQFGHGEVKATGLWLKGLPPLEPTVVLPKVGPNGENWRRATVHTMPPGPLRRLLRSRTYPGIADAMASQWGAL